MYVVHILFCNLFITLCGRHYHFVHCSEGLEAGQSSAAGSYPGTLLTSKSVKASKERMHELNPQRAPTIEPFMFIHQGCRKCLPSTRHSPGGRI